MENANKRENCIVRIMLSNIIAVRKNNFLLRLNRHLESVRRLRRNELIIKEESFCSEGEGKTAIAGFKRGEMV